MKQNVPDNRTPDAFARRSDQLGNAPLARLLWSLSLPGVVGMFVMATYNIAGTFWVSRLPNEAEAIAALTVAFPLQMISAAVANGLSVGVASLVSRRLGEQRAEEVADIAGHAVVLPLLAGLLLMLLVLAAPDTLLRAFGAHGHALTVARPYLTTVALGLPFLLFLMTVGGLYRGTGDPRTPMIVMMISGLLNIVLDPFLIYGWAGLPRLEVQGVAVATVISQVTVFVWLAVQVARGRGGFRIERGHLRPRWRVVREIYRVGAPASAMQFVQSIVISAFNAVLGHYGDGQTPIAAYGLTFRLLNVVFPVFFGVSQGLLPIAGYNYGARNYRRMWGAYRLAAIWTGGFGLLVTITMGALAVQAIGIFAHEPQLAAIGVVSVRFVMATMVLVAPQMMGVAMLQGMGYGTAAMFLALTRQVVFLLPALFLMSQQFGMMGAFAATPVADTLSFCVTIGYLWRVRAHHHREPAVLAPAA